MPDEFHWFERGKRPPKVRVTPCGLAFNRSACDLLSGAEHVLLDLGNKVLVARPSPDGDSRALTLRRTRDGAVVSSRLWQVARMYRDS